MKALQGNIWMVGVAALLVLGGCAKHEMAADAGAVAAAAVESPEGAFLAYEHTVQLQLPGEAIAARVKAVADACQSAKFGDCSVLNVSQQAGDMPSGSVQVRIAPKGVEPIIALAADKGEVTTRNTQAEDLAQQVADTRLMQARLKNEHERLLEYQQRRDLAVADLLTISQRMSEIEAGLEQANRDAAQQHRRIDTQLVTINIESTSSQRSRSEIGRAFGDFGDIFTTSLAYLIRVAAGLLPVLIVGGLALWGVRVWWRRRRRNKVGNA
ncbi:DUF4349 domain-containing protein [Stenotrophomonas sp. SY1]|uniref:DUF4349 domain-containing protein n=1 Tax=Stenotrophomonas sp. SY1 TaxID=477235 RepID=UPI001E2D4E92|nr:DUF4349 domain-containing protein [Stenotrophomonas sp. SY1]MCD9086370.1 DUF4349 domain-containing protein [Stenotrophomonas sp. SY1]